MSEETIADILAEMFEFSDKRIEEGRAHAMTSESVGLIVHQLAKRFEAAWKRESAGNAAAMREALENLTRFAEVDIRGLENLAKYAIDHSMYGGGVLRAVAGAIREGKNALAAQARNCDKYANLHDAWLAWQDDCAKDMQHQIKFHVWLYATEKGGAE